MKMKLFILIPFLALTCLGAMRFVQVDNTQPMPWTTIANPPGIITNPVGASVNFNAKDATNIGAIAGASLQVTGGATNQAVFVCTNTATGQGKWQATGSFFANNATYMSGSSVVLATNLVAITGCVTFANGYVSFPVGWIELHATQYDVVVASGSKALIQLRCNEVVIAHAADITATTTSHGPALSIRYYNTNATNTYCARIYSITNSLSTFSGGTVP